MSFSLRLNSEQEANRGLRDAWRMGLLAAAISLTLTIVYASGPGLAHVDPWAWLDVVILVVLSFAVRQGSRVGAVLLLLYYLVSKIVFWVDEHAFIGVPLAIFFVYFFWQGVRAAFTASANSG
ncbi:MAG: hypothetical protein KDE09_04095 [Anaerolineales bacterium]|nr:hypothetical protein [Anaerolineales bacterium]MCB0008083.1 hypothetical protein [Anaerolineales bacterium]MCB0016946.1 hypothetical protein [Anaerolineales bacterium]MCB0028627.1 hypothetical protein [Anaerolineales bacterium]MCB8960729.1 hypothetical protein [Ardenticatenales bacterium]